MKKNSNLTPSQRSSKMVLIILAIWFAISFVTNIIGPMLPILIADFNLSLLMASFLPFSFFLSYAVMSIPAGLLIEKIGSKKTILLSIGLNFIASLLFAGFPFYTMALLCLFLLGIGMAMLQVVISPLMRVAGGEEHFAFNSVLAQLIFGIASFISPFIFSMVIEGLSKGGSQSPFFVKVLSHIVQNNVTWSGIYWLFSLLFFLLFVLILSVKFPRFELAESEKSGSLSTYSYLLKRRHVYLYFLGIMAYVGTEQGLANWMTQFLLEYHNIDPLKKGAHVISLFCGLMAAGCCVGLMILKLVSSKMVLRGAVITTIGTLLLALFGPTNVAIIAFPACGFLISVIFSIVFSLALNSEEKFHGSFSGILCTGIFGGALVPLLIGWLGDIFGLRQAMLFILVPLIFLGYISIIARPLISNKTISLRISRRSRKTAS